MRTTGQATAWGAPDKLGPTNARVVPTWQDLPVRSWRAPVLREPGKDLVAGGASGLPAARRGGRGGGCRQAR